jgi:hypothetical protein
VCVYKLKHSASNWDSLWTVFGLKFWP